MDKYICDVLDGKGKNYILPFFWQHGEEESIIREEMCGFMILVSGWCV